MANFREGQEVEVFADYCGEECWVCKTVIIQAKAFSTYEVEFPDGTRSTVDADHIRE